MEHLPDIQQQLTSKDLFDAFKSQLVRDFERSNFPSAFVASLVPDYHLIRERIEFELQQSEKRSDFNLMHLLYRVDISEAQLKKYLNENQSENHITVMAELIIKRVLQKVVIKRYYKKNENL